MQQSYHRKSNRGRNGRYNPVNNNDIKNSFRTQDNYSSDRWKPLILSDTTLYNVARFLMGNEVQIITKSGRIEGVLRSFDSSTVCLSKVIVYDFTVNENIPLMKELLEGKEVSWKDIYMIKVLGTNGKTESVLVDHEISQRKPVNKLPQMDDKNFIPYFDENETKLHDEKDGDDLSITMAGDQCCWYNPEDMIKVNEEKFNLKSTFDDKMEEYTTPIDKSDPLLQEKYERAEKLVWEMENDASLRRVRVLEDDTEQDEESRFSSVLHTVPSTIVPDTGPAPAISVKLNPNAPEFRPRTRADGHESLAEEVCTSVASVNLMPESIQQHQYMPRLSLHMSMGQPPTAQQPHMVPISQQPQQLYPGQPRLVNAGPQWTTVHHQPAMGGQAGPTQFLVQQYVPGHQAPMLTGPMGGQPLYQTQRQMSAPPQLTMETAPQSGLVFYSTGGPTQYFVQSSVADPICEGQHMSPWPVVDGNVSGQTLRPPQLMSATMPMLHQHPGQPQPTHQQSLATYYTQSPHHPHPLMATGHTAFHPQILFSQQTQMPQTPSMQNYMTNGRP